MTVLAIYESEGKNALQTARITNVSRNSIMAWRDDIESILEEYKKFKRVDDSGVLDGIKQDLAEEKGRQPTDKETALEKQRRYKLMKGAHTFEEKKEVLKGFFTDSSFKFLNHAHDHIDGMSAKDAVTASATSLDKAMRLNGEATHIIQRRVEDRKARFIDQLIRYEENGWLTFANADRKQQFFNDLDSVQEIEAEFEEV